MNDRDGADTFKRISELEEQLDKRYKATRKKATELVSQSHSEASRIIDRKNEVLAKILDMAGEASEAGETGEAGNDGSKTGSTSPSPQYGIDSKIVSEFAERLFRLLIERKRM
jgi:hypothetical protein